MRPKIPCTLLWNIFRGSLPNVKISVCRRLMKYPKVFIDICCSNRQYLASMPKKVFVDKILEVRRGKYPIIKYRHFFASLHKPIKQRKSVVTNNNGRLGLCEGRKSVEQGSTAQCGWCSLLLQQCVSRCITEFHHIDFLPSGLGAVVLAALCNSDSRSLLCRLCLLGFYLLG